jgi:3-hydroxybutyryl-CoA dehydratase
MCARIVPARLGIGRIAQQLAGDRRAADPAHHEGLAQPVGRRELEQHFRRPRTRPEGGAQHGKFGRPIQRGRAFALALGLPDRRIAPQDQPVPFTGHEGIEAPGLARGAARFTAQAFDRRGRPEVARRRRSEAGGDQIALIAHANGHSCGLWHKACRVVRGPRLSGRSYALSTNFAAMHGLYLEDLKVGMWAMFGKTVTDADVMAFAGVSGDTNPIHLHDGFARSTRFERRIAHGMLNASFISAVIGTKLPGPGSIYVSQMLTFQAPVGIGDTVTAICTITGIDDERRRVTLKTQCLKGDEVVVDGEATVSVPRRTPRPK